MKTQKLYEQDYLEVCDMEESEIIKHSKKDILSAIDQLNSELEEYGTDKESFSTHYQKSKLANILGHIAFRLHILEVAASK